MAPNEAERGRWNDAQWTAMWPKRERLTDRVTPSLLDALEPRPGERILDVGAGGGRASLAAAAAVEPDGSVTGADLSVQLVALARQRAVDAGRRNVTFTVADLQTDRVHQAGLFDAVMSQFGVMFFEDPVAAFTNIGAHLRPGGRLAIACWRSITQNPWFPGPAVAPYLAAAPPAPSPVSPGPFAFADAERVTGILSDAGWEEVKLRG